MNLVQQDDTGQKTFFNPREGGFKMASKKVDLAIKGMTCVSCAQTIEKNLKKRKGVHSVNVNFASQAAMVSYDSAVVGIEDLEKIIKDTGYEVIKLSGQRTVEFKVIGMASDHCAGIVKKAVERLDGVKEVEANYSNSSARVSYDESKLSTRQIMKAISAAGYKPQLIEVGEDAVDVEKKARQKEIRTLKRKFIWAAIFTLPIVYIAMVELVSKSLLPGFLSPEHFPVRFTLFQMILSLPIIFVGRDFYRIGFPNLFKGSPNMDSLIAVGTLAAYSYSFYA
ncbi:MAG: heavy metal translocating P-type ATPase, partial [Candidatus Aminicenantes bacterium]